MPVNWDEFTPVEKPPATGGVDWSQFEPAGMIDSPSEISRRATMAAAPPGSYPTAPGTELITAIGEDPKGFVKSIPGIAFGAAAAPGRLAYYTAADLLALGNQETGREFGGNLRAMMTGEDLPADKLIAEVAKFDRAEAVKANLFKALPELASMMAVNPPGAAGRLLAAGFSADMILHAQPLFEEYAAEINKPAEEQDAGKRAELEAGIIQTFGFAPLAGKHAARGDARPTTPAEVAGRMLAQEVKRTELPMTEAGGRTEPIVRWEDFTPVRERGTAAERPTEMPLTREVNVGEQTPLPPAAEGRRKTEDGRQRAEDGERTEETISSTPEVEALPTRNVPGAAGQGDVARPAEAAAAAPEQSLTRAAGAGKVPSAGAETITGSNVREGTEMPAESGAIPGPTPARRAYPRQRPQDAPFNLAGEKGIDLERIAREKAQAEANARANAEFQAKHQQDLLAKAKAYDEGARIKDVTPAGYGPGGGGHGSTAYPPLEFPVLEGSIPAGVARVLRPMETPEILRLATEMSGSVPALKRLKKYMGFARAGKITMDYEAFRDPQRLAMTLAHEMGHVNDWFPEGTMTRGNVIGRLIGSVRTFLKGSFGNLSNKELRQELVDLSAYWHPWDRDKAPDHYRKYRDSAVELYAEAVSVLLNSPGLLEQRAPKFYKAFFEHLDAKPKFKEEFFALQDLLSRGPEAVLGERLKQSREGFEKGEAMLHEKIAFRQAARNSFKDFLTKVRIQSSDIASFVRRKLGSRDPRQPSEFDRLYEEWKFDDNRNAADVAKIYHEMIQPLVKTGLDEHAFGQVLELQRIMGGIDAYRDMQAMRKALGPEKMKVLAKASEEMANLERQGLADELGGGPIGALDRAGIPGELLDVYRQLATAQGTRAELANPQGRSPIMAEAELKQVLATVTPEQRAALLDAAARFRQLMFERVTEAREVGIINKLTYDNTIVPNRESYAAFRPLDKIEEYVTPMVRRARGALQDIENPFITTLLKLQSLNNLIETQRLKNSVRDKFSAMFPGEFTPAQTRWTGRRMEAVPAKPGVGRVKILENGRLKEYDVDPYVAKMFEQLTPTDSFWLNKVLEVPFRMGIYPLIIKYNPGFLFAFNPRRDMARTIRNLYATEGVTRRELLPNYASPEVLRAVNDYLQGRPNPLAEAMIRNKAITPSWQGFAHLEREDVMADLLRRYRLADQPTKNAAVRTLMWLPNKINEAGSFLEALPKFASYQTLIKRGVEPERAAYLVRNYAGTPNFKVKGEWASVQNSYIPFINIFTQGWKADLKLATNPKTAGGWWLQWALQHGWQATLAGLAVAGVFGDDIKKLYAGVSEYDRTNYGVLPLGQQLGEGEFGRKTVYLRFPRDETSRFFSALTYKATRAAADQIMGNAPHAQGLPTEIFAFGAGVVPSPTPVLNVAGAWKDYLAGRNPIDPFRNQPVIGQREFKAGGLPAAGDMLTWTLNQSGALNLIRWNPQAETATELAVSGLPVVNRLVKISDQGYREQQRDSEALEATAKAKLRVQYGDAAQSLTAKHAWLQSLGNKRTEEQNRLYYRLHGWVTNLYTPMDEAAWNLRGEKGRQAEVIKRLNAEAERFQRAVR